VVEKYIISTDRELETFLTKLNHKAFSFDCETTSEDIKSHRRTYGLSKPLPDKLFLQALNYYYLELEGISFCDGTIAGYVDFDNNPELMKSFTKIEQLFTKSETIVAHNIAFDMKVLKKYGISLEGKKLYCTMVADHLLDEEREHGLKKLAKSILGYEETMSWEEARKKGPQVFGDYALNDAIWTWELMRWQQQHLRQQELIYIFRNIEMPFQHCLVEMESNGVLVDVEKLEATKKRMIELKEQLVMDMLQMLGKRATIQMSLDGSSSIISPINFNSNPALCDILFKQRGLKSIEQTPGGATSVGKKTIEKYKDKDEFVGLLYKYKMTEKLINGFLEPLPSFICGDGKVRPFFRDTGTKTGRLSSQNFNYQQLPRENKEVGVSLRDLFISDSGYKMMAIDYSGQEVRVAAVVSKDETLINALNNGMDLHLTVANKSFNLGIPEECLVETHPDYEKYKNKFKVERTKAKSITFGILYGKTPKGFADDFGISETEAQKMVDDYFAGMPRVRDSIKKAHKDIDTKGYVVYPSGRRRHFSKIQNGDWSGYPKKAYRQSYNSIIQGTSADMIRLAMINVLEFSRNNKEYDIRLLATVHDELIVMFKEQYVNVVPEKIVECFKNVGTYEVEMSADYAIGNSYGECK
jgi:DNA polymerase-1